MVLLASFICIPLASANDRLGISNNNTINKTQRAGVLLQNQSLTPNVAEKQKLAAIVIFQNYKENMTEWQKKLPTDLLYIIDPKFPEMGNTREQVKEMMRGHNQLVYADEAIKIFGISQTSGQPVGDHVNVYISVNASVSTRIVESYFTKVDNIFKDFTGVNRITGWVDLNNLEKIASLKEVSGIDLVIPPSLGSYEPEQMNDTVSISGNGILNTPTSAVSFIPTLVTSTSPVSTTRATPISVMNICAAIIGAGMIILLRLKNVS